MSKFSSVAISNIGTTVTGKTPSSDFPKDFGSEFPFVTPSDPFDKKYIETTERYLSKTGVAKLKGKLLPPETIMVTCIGSAMGKIAMTKVQSITNQQINSIIVSDKYFPGYIYYALLNNYKLLRNAAGGSTALPLLNKSDFDLLAIRIHNLKEEQQKIAAVLSALDAKIDCNNRINAELEAMAKTLYDYWFVQFDFPYDFAQGKPDQNGKPYKSSGGKMTYNPTLKRDIPAGWKVGQLNQLVSLERGVTYGKKDVCTSDTGETVGVLRATNVTGNVIDVDDLVYVPDSKVSSAQIITKFETLIVMSSGSKEHVGKNGTYYFDNPLGFGAFCSKITASVNSRYFVQTFLQSNWFKAYIKNQCLGTNINNLTNNHINECPILKPDEKTQSIFEATVKSCYEKVACNTLENHSLQQLRDWLLPMLMNGQVTVK